MSEKLKFIITYGKTINLGNYESVKLSVTKEYYQGEADVEAAHDELKYIVNALLEESR